MNAIHFVAVSDWQVSQTKFLELHSFLVKTACIQPELYQSF